MVEGLAQLVKRVKGQRWRLAESLVESDGKGFPTLNCIKQRVVRHAIRDHGSIEGQLFRGSGWQTRHGSAPGGMSFKTRGAEVVDE
ncbi:hypothetical protein V6N13_089131 [Hibiscus sabdariffa]